MAENVAYVQKNLQETREQSMKFSPGRKSSKQRKLQCRGHVQKVGETRKRDNQTDQCVWDGLSTACVTHAVRQLRSGVGSSGRHRERGIAANSYAPACTRNGKYWGGGGSVV